MARIFATSARVIVSLGRKFFPPLTIFLETAYCRYGFTQGTVDKSSKVNVTPDWDWVSHPAEFPTILRNSALVRESSGRKFSALFTKPFLISTLMKSFAQLSDISVATGTITVPVAEALPVVFVPLQEAFDEPDHEAAVPPEVEPDPASGAVHLPSKAFPERSPVGQESIGVPPPPPPPLPPEGMRVQLPFTVLVPAAAYPEKQLKAHVWVLVTFPLEIVGHGRVNSIPDVLTPVLIVPPASLAKAVEDKRRQERMLINNFIIILSS